MSGAVDPGGESTSWYVEYGTTTAYGSRTEARSAGNGTAAVDVSQQLTGLETGVTYHYRVVASERRRHEPRRRQGVHHARSARGRTGAAGPSAPLGEPRRHGRPERPLDGLVDRVRDDDALRLANRHPLGRRWPSRSASPSGSAA